MKFKVKKSIICIICILSILFMIQIPAQAAVADEEVGSTYYDSTTNLSASYGGLTSYPKTNLDFYTNYLSARDQGSTGLCWSYAAMASLETLMIKNGDGSILTKNNSSRLSPVHMGAATCMVNMPEELTYAGVRAGSYRRYVDSGAADDIPIAYFTSWRGPTNETIFKNNLSYTDTIVVRNFEENDAKRSKIVGVNGLMYLSGLNYENNAEDAWNDINNKKHRDTIKTAIYNYGSVVGNYLHNDDCLNIDGNKYSYYKNNTLRGFGVSGHSISVIGWDDNYSKSNFKEGAQPKNNGAWLCKNSWDISWGQDGCFWISYEDVTLFSKSKGATVIGEDLDIGGGYAFVNYQKIDDNVKLYQNTTCCPDIDLKLNKATYINVFDIDSDYTVLKRINFETTKQNSQYSIYYIPLNSSSVPNPDQSTWKKLCSGTTRYCGYISAKIKGKGFNIPKENGNKFAIGIKFIGYDTTIGYYTEGHPEANLGNSYITFDDGNVSASNSKILNQTDLCISKVSKVNNLYKSNAFVIKAVAEKAAEPATEPQTEPEIIKGDADCDGYVDINDVTCIQRYLAEYIEFDEIQLKAADVNGDGFVNIKDATKIQRFLAEFETL